MEAKMKWNQKYQERLKEFNHLEPNKRLIMQSSYLKGGTALDLACGLGGNSQFLAGRDYHVHAVDISDVALSFLKEDAAVKQLSIQTHLCDLSEWHTLQSMPLSFDLIIMTYYLDRMICSLVQSLVKENGYFFMETYFLSPLDENSRVSDRYKLQPQELLSVFKEWKILFFEENEMEGRQTIFCQKV